MSLPLITVGCHLNVRQSKTELLWQAEVMACRLTASDGGAPEYYVHYVGMNKRLDEWIELDRMDLGSLIPARKTSTPLPSKTTTAQKKLKKKSSSLAVQKVEAVKDEDEEEMEALRHGGSMTRRHEEIARLKNIDWIEFGKLYFLGKFRLECWYFSPYPQELINPNGPTTIVLCEFCLHWHADRTALARHLQKCPLRCPPGTEICRQGNLSFFELDGHRHKEYCRKLCLLSKLFLDHKTLFYDVDPFLYYILVENDAFGSHLIGYFSKEKDSADNYNVACILTLPCYQRRGFGRLLIELSYELTRREGRTGSPEKPLSDLGLLSYRSFWSEILVQHLIEAADNGLEPSIESLAKSTGIIPDDIIHTLTTLDCIKYRRGQHIIVLSERVLQEYDKTVRKIKVRLDAKALKWTPPVFTPAQLRYL